MTDPRGKTDLERAAERVRANAAHDIAQCDTLDELDEGQSNYSIWMRQECRAAAAGADLATAVGAFVLTADERGGLIITGTAELSALERALAAYVAAVEGEG